MNKPTEKTIKKFTTKFTVILLSSIGLLCAGSISAYAKQTVPNVYTGGTGATTDAVNMFQPTRTQPPVDKAENNLPITLNKTVIIYNIQNSNHETRAQRRKRAIGHRYLGFIKQYRGYKYPF